MSAGERSARDALISGALATQPDRIRRAASTACLFFGGAGSGNAGCGGSDWLDTLLGPEETDRAGPLRRACCLFDLVRDRPSVRPAHLQGGCLVAEWVWSLFVV